MLNITGFPFVGQFEEADNPICCIRMIAQHYGKTFSRASVLSRLENKDHIRSIADMEVAARQNGLSSNVRIIAFKELFKQKKNLPFILQYNNGHFVIIYALKRNKFQVADSKEELITITAEDLKAKVSFIDPENTTVQILSLQPDSAFSQFKNDEKLEKSFGGLIKILNRFKPSIFLLFITVLAGSILQLVFPIMTQVVVDEGIKNNNKDLVYMVLFLTIVLLIANLIIAFIKQWTLIHLTTRVNFYNLSIFIGKIMRLPMSFFNSSVIGDLIQRIDDHKRIDDFISYTLLSSIFAILSITIFGAVLAYYNVSVFLVIYIFTALELLWIFSFLGKLQNIDNRKFFIASDHKNKIIEIIDGIQDIKLNRLDAFMKSRWEQIQLNFFTVNQDSLKLKQYESAGTTLLEYLRKALVVLFCALAIIDGDMSIGAMLSIIFIMGQLDQPITSLINLILMGQMAKLSLDRLSEVNHLLSSEDELNQQHKAPEYIDQSGISINNLEFRYKNAETLALDGITLNIPNKKVTAIVGKSGSGKSTLLKILLKTVDYSKGSIRFDTDINLSDINTESWLDNCATVLLESFIYTESITFNICLTNEPDTERLNQIASLINIDEFVKVLPAGFDTQIGQFGIKLSNGQRQRILLARAVYKNPAFLFLDEATNSLDAKNETQIMNNLTEFFGGRTVVVVAHRLSTVKGADQIIVLSEGKVAEIGTHASLIAQQGTYYDLIVDQLDIEA